MEAMEMEGLIKTLKSRFEKNPKRHPELIWSQIEDKLRGHKEKIGSLFEMERTGGEPDCVSQNSDTGEYVFYDCSAESPSGRRSLCYDRKALDERKEYKPQSSAMDMALDMGIDLLTVEEYAFLQTLGSFDMKTSSWVKTPDKIRKLGGAVFCDFRYDTVFVYHNGASSYYATRGFRGKLII